MLCWSPMLKSVVSRASAADKREPAAERSQKVPTRITTRATTMGRRNRMLLERVEDAIAGT